MQRDITKVFHKQIVNLKLIVMKNLFLIGCMLLCFSFASAQDTIPGKKKSSPKTDTVHHKKNKQYPSTRKTDTVNKQRTDKKKGTPKSTNPTTVPPTRDSINGTRP